MNHVHLSIKTFLCSFFYNRAFPLNLGTLFSIESNAGTLVSVLDGEYVVGKLNKFFIPKQVTENKERKEGEEDEGMLHECEEDEDIWYDSVHENINVYN